MAFLIGFLILLFVIGAAKSGNALKKVWAISAINGPPYGIPRQMTA